MAAPKPLSKSDRLKILLEKGYFPEELPPPFVTHPIATYRASILKAWASLPTPKACEYETYSYPRVGTKRRKLAIVNPVAQLPLAAEIANEWVDLSKFMKSSKVSIDTPTLMKDGPRAIPKPDWGIKSLKQLETAADFSHLLVSDISRFYGTIYTHSIAWALHGKAWCKANLHKPAMSSSIGNRLEKLATKGQDNQTIGIPMGPDTSRVLAEIVAIGIEREFLASTEIPDGRAFRFVDDWFISYDNAGEAEHAIAHLSRACSAFEIELNHEKTSVFEPSEPLEDYWPSELRSFRIGSHGREQAKQIQDFFLLAFHRAKAHPTESVLDFAIKRTRGISVDLVNSAIYQDYLFKSVRANARTLPVVAQVLINLNAKGHRINRTKVLKLILDVIASSSLVEHHGELSWALFLAKGLRISIPSSALSQIVEIESSVCALLILDLRRLNLIDGALNTTFWETYMTEDALRSRMWLLAYEASIKGWLPSPKNHISLHAHFNVLQKKGVYFYDINRNVPTLKKSRQTVIEEAMRRWQAHAAFASILMGYD